jgi:hypothetical protein
VEDAKELLKLCQIWGNRMHKFFLSPFILKDLMLK